MRKILSILTILWVGLFGASAAGYAYPYLSFTGSDAQVHSIGVDGLVVTFADGKIMASNGRENVELPLAQVAEFHFSRDASGVKEAEVAGEGAVDVYTASGVSAGSYASCREAAASLPAGVYIVSRGSESFKIVVK